VKQEQYLFVNALFVENMLKKKTSVHTGVVTDLPISTETPDNYDEY
jgi:hypothetical protein